MLVLAINLFMYLSIFIVFFINSKSPGSLLFREISIAPMDSPTWAWRVMSARSVRFSGMK